MRTLSLSEVEKQGVEKKSGKHPFVGWHSVRCYGNSSNTLDCPSTLELDVKQFIVMCAVGFILAEEDAKLTTFGGMLGSGDQAYRRAMSDVVTAYLSFDREGKGYFTAEEFKGFMTYSKRADVASSFFSEERWAELDVTGDGKVEFEEFVYAFSKWVSADDEAAAEDDDASVNRTKNELTPRMTLALQLARAKMEKQGMNVNFTRIIMRFPKISKVFDRIKTSHDKYDLNKDGKVQLQELSDSMLELMNAKGHVDEEADADLKHIENLFMLSDLDHHGMEKGLDVKEFIVFCAVGFILAEAGKSPFADIFLSIIDHTSVDAIQ